MIDILANIPTNESLSESFFEAVLKRLESFGYEVTNEDSWMIQFASEKVANNIMNRCNVSSVPDGLFHIAVDMTCGEFLLAMKQTGRLNLSDLDLNGAITSIKEGDVQVNFANGQSDEEKLNSFLNYLLHGKDGELICYRKLKW